MISHITYGLPLLVQNIAFWYWSNLALPNKYLIDKGNYSSDAEAVEARVSAVETLLQVTVIYLLCYEITAIVKKKHMYLTSAARMFNIVTPALLLINVFHLLDFQNEWFWTVQTYAALAIWFRFLLYLRTFHYLSFFIRLVSNVFAGMFRFLFIFLLGVFAFADAFMSIEFVINTRGALPSEEDMEPWEAFSDKIATKIAAGSTETGEFLRDYFVAWSNAFLVSLGEFGFTPLEAYRELDTIVFILCCLINIIMLLNLLIAVISEDFANIMADAT